MVDELHWRKNELQEKQLKSIYFGGGTPSLLNESELELIFHSIADNFTIAENAEITLEANPDDLNEVYLSMLRKFPVNRLSIGIQSFRDEDLKMMNRAHTSADAQRVIRRAQETGFTNLTIDLIYGIPGMNNEAWRSNIEKAIASGVQHISAYCLTVEPKTALAHFIKTGKAEPVNEAVAAEHFSILLDVMKKNNFIPYEISNFARKDFIAKHNSSYWFGEEYLGIGPSAHSFNGKRRRWNISNNAEYISRVEKNERTFEEEILSERSAFNEFVLTRLRTMWGISIQELEKRSGKEVVLIFEKNIQRWIKEGKVALTDNNYILTENGRLFADHIAADLFRV